MYGLHNMHMSERQTVSQKYNTIVVGERSKIKTISGMNGKQNEQTCLKHGKKF